MAGCENFISEQQEFIFINLILEPVQRSEDGCTCNMRKFESFDVPESSEPVGGDLFET